MLKPFPWPAQKMSAKYTIGVGVEGIAKIWEQEYIEGDCLEDILFEVMGVDDIEYDSPGGSFIYFSIVSNCDNELTHLKILEVIKRFISDD